MKKLFLILCLIFGFLFYVGWCRFSLSNYNSRGLTNIYNMSGDFISIKNDTIHPPVAIFMYPVSQNEKFSVQITGAYVFSCFAIYDILGFKEYKEFVPKEWPINSFSLDISKPIHFVSSASNNPIKDLLRNSIFDKGGRITHILVIANTMLTGNTEIMRIR